MKTTSNMFTMAALALLMLASACKEDDEVISKAGTFYGNAVSLGDGKARSWVKTDKEGNPLTMGVALSKEAMSSLPQHTDNPMGFEYPLSLPTQKAQLPFNFVMLGWNPQGHEPENVYTLPHFDFHFYMTSDEERMNIGLNDPKIDIAPDATFIPADYFTTPGGVPMMGKHWIDKFSPELNGKAFATTFLYGSYDGHVTFMEPMITLEYILSKPGALMEIKQPAAFEKPGYYPTKYMVNYDTATEEYLITLQDMVKK